MGLGYSDVKITYGGESITMSWDGSEASAPIKVDGESTPYQTADARHRADRAVRLAARLAWPDAGSFDEGSDEWDDLAYKVLDEAKANGER